MDPVHSSGGVARSDTSRAMLVHYSRSRSCQTEFMLAIGEFIGDAEHLDHLDGC